MRIGLGAAVARTNVNETIAGLWTFANVLGIKVDDINEFTPNLGVLVDGLLIKDAGIPEAAVTAHEAALAILESQIVDGTILARLGDAETIAGIWTHTAKIILSNTFLDVIRASAASTLIAGKVTGDSVDRYNMFADGKQEWGSGAAAKDTNLFRVAAGHLKTDDRFSVGDRLDILTDFTTGFKNTTLTADVTSFDSGAKPIQRIDNDALWTVRGINGAINGRHIWMVNVDTTTDMFLTHQDGAATAAERIILPNGASYRIDFGSSAHLWYDGTSSRWRMLGARTT